MKKLTDSMIIERATKIHFGKYSYANTKITGIGRKRKITFVCKLHGEQKVSLYNHLSTTRPTKCPYCSGTKLHISDFKKRANSLYGNKFDLSRVNFVSTKKDKITIICPIHGPFEACVNDFLRKHKKNHANHGCVKCGNESTGRHREKSQNEFIQKAKSIHGDRYDYSKTIYKGITENIIIICKIHGEQLIYAHNHINGQPPAGCGSCGNISKAQKNTLGIKKFIQKARKIHGDKYDYSQAKYTLNYKHLTIICPVHGPFQQTPSQHIDKMCGCGECGFELSQLGKTLNELSYEESNVPGIFYIIKCYNDIESFFKVGITSKTVSQRFRNKNYMPYNYEILLEHQTTIVGAFELERDALKKIKKLKLTYEPKMHFGGHRECLTENPLDYIKELKKL